MQQRSETGQRGWWTAVTHRVPHGGRALGLCPSQRARTGFTRGRVAMFAAAIACAMPATLALSATPASAYKTINEKCILRVFEPENIFFGEPTMVYGGEVDCEANGSTWSEVEACLEVQNTETGKWYVVSGTCKHRLAYETFNPIEGEHVGLCGVNYRAHSYGEVWHGGAAGREGEWGTARQETSSVFKDCG
jgi:hypothetical protein